MMMINYILTHQYEVDQDGNIGYFRRHDSRQKKLMLPNAEEAITDVQIRLPVGDISDGHYQNKSW